MQKEDVMTTLDEIQARNDETKAKARWAGTKPSPAHEDRNKLVAALRSVEALADSREKESATSFARTFSGEPFPAMLMIEEVRAAIREALGC